MLAAAMGQERAEGPVRQRSSRRLPRTMTLTLDSSVPPAMGTACQMADSPSKLGELPGPGG